MRLVEGGLEEEERGIARLESLEVGCESVLRAAVEAVCGWRAVGELLQARLARVILRADGVAQWGDGIEHIVDLQDLVVAIGRKLGRAGSVKLGESGTNGCLRAGIRRSAEARECGVNIATVGTRGE